MITKRIALIVFVISLSIIACGGGNALPLQATPTSRPVLENSNPPTPKSQNQKPSPVATSSQPPEVPIPPDAYNLVPGSKVIGADESCNQFFYDTKLHNSELISFYKDKMAQNGWNLAWEEIGEEEMRWPTSNSIPEGGPRQEQKYLFFEKSGHRAGVFLLLPDDEYAKIGYTQAFINPDDWYFSTCIRFPADIPYMGELRGHVYLPISTGDPTLPGKQIFYRSTQSVDKLVDLYRTEMPVDGWTLVDEQKSQDTWFFEFNKPGRLEKMKDPLLQLETVRILIYPELWGDTEVTMLFK